MQDDEMHTNAHGDGLCDEDNELSGSNKSIEFSGAAK
jgi:hypothetical protein